MSILCKTFFYIAMICKNPSLSLLTAGFRTPIGTLVIAGLHFLPIVLYIYQTHLLTNIFPDLRIPVLAVICVLAIGRCVCMSVEVRDSRCVCCIT